MNTNSNESLAKNAERDLLEAVLDGDGESWSKLSSELSGERTFRILAVATSGMVFRRWPDDPSLDEIVAYVSEIVGRFPGDLPVAPIVIEAVIRGVLNEPEILSGTPREDVVLAELFIIASMRYDVLHSSKERELYISEVLEAAE